MIRNVIKNRFVCDELKQKIVTLINKRLVAKEGNTKNSIVIKQKRCTFDFDASNDPNNTVSNHQLLLILTIQQYYTQL
jgi:hypothetical protein